MALDNVVRGTCKEFEKRLQTRGVIDRYGNPQPGNLGTMNFVLTIDGFSGEDIKHDAAFNAWMEPKITQVEQDSKACYKLTDEFMKEMEIIPNTYIEILEWIPSCKVTTNCQKEWKRLLQSVRKHEQEHVKHVKERTKQANRQLRKVNFKQHCGSKGKEKLKEDFRTKVITILQKAYDNIYEDSDVLHEKGDIDLPKNFCKTCQCTIPDTTVPERVELTIDVEYYRKYRHHAQQSISSVDKIDWEQEGVTKDSYSFKSNAILQKVKEDSPGYDDEYDEWRGAGQYSAAPLQRADL